MFDDECPEDYDENISEEDKIKMLKEILTEKDEIDFWKDEYEIEIDPKCVEILEIIKETFNTIDFVAKINEKETYTLHFESWYYPATRLEPEDSGYEISIKEED